MKLFCPILVFVFFTLAAFRSSATSQVPDLLVYNNDTIPIYSNPLESYFDTISRIRPDELFEEIGENSTACWRGYIAYWELKNDSLFLLELHGDSTLIDLKLIFKDRKTDKKIFADWYNYSLFYPHGKLLNYVHMGYNSTYEYEREFIFSKGKLVGTKEYDNTKSRKSIYSQDMKLLQKFIQDHTSYATIKGNLAKSAKVYVEVYHVNEAGKIDSVRVVRGCDPERDMEAMRVIKSIPEWDVLYDRGRQIQMCWVLPVRFGL